MNEPEQALRLGALRADGVLLHCMEAKRSLRAAGRGDVRIERGGVQFQPRVWGLAKPRRMGTHCRWS